MHRYVLTTLLTLSLVGLTACGSKDKKSDEAGSAEPTEETMAQDMQFDPQGSDSGKIDGLYTINFEYDKANLNSEARDLLTKNAEWIKGNGSLTVQIEGHCDERGSVEYNLALGERRAQAVRGYLNDLGVDTNRMTIISYGKEKPLIGGDDEVSYAKNRRANFVPLPQ